MGHLAINWRKAMQELNQQEIDLVGGATVGGGLIGGLTGLIGAYGGALYDLGANLTGDLVGFATGVVQIGETLVGGTLSNIGSIFTGTSH
ncbi:hypothetical protein GSH05_22835 [Burkholderia pseudomallei]|uniref:Uncharacterized protein n=7 Tax=pseudomallei group TaxID=111527 RepID=Q63QD3_BURPS|nr:hypothetical protein BURPS1710b_3623 [Burkholderia pseudomallei 1710b]ACQ98653.1 conserved hypothetical protein [Burkholderia pseudomallei MSHR346]AUG19718.1 hypothetical protein CXQ84_02740 [Burkholderia pseudomallei]KGS17304.1 hypothetical protein X989_5419 [Burkholderia pseudomallei MSHR4378]PNW96423.1 hypothetical protein CF649_29235 [Burkholderia sp. 136(2017)]PNX11558.1 hypothetical protein CF650_29565 [Burkholderia sp. 129]PNX25515.1 hypothetical protein CF647_30105 [Burkholderia sp